MAQRIHADVLIPGRGDPIANGVVVFDEREITYAGSEDSAPPADPADETTQVSTVMPGMWDCHTHFVGSSTPDLQVMASMSPVTAAARAVRDAAAMLNGGVTSVRDVGGLGLKLAPAAADGSISSPKIFAAGRILSTTGGHGDIHSLPLDFVHQFACSHGFSILCDGVAEVTKAVRLNLRENAQLIKICASGGVMSEIDHPMHQQFSDEEMRAIVEEAARAERIVAAHCHGTTGVLAALRAGCHTIEHGSFLTEEACDMMIEQGAIFVPTRFVVEALLPQLDMLPPYAYEKGVMVSEAHSASLKLAIAKGVKIAAGCDIFVSGQMYGESSREIMHLINAGMTDLEAIEAATANGPETLGPQAPNSGQLREGFDSDVIAFDANPLDDRSIWGDPDRVTHIWQSGVRKK